MIVVSGVLVAVALVLLVVGLQVSLGYIYASIGVSLLAFLLLGVAARQRRRAAAAPVAPAARPEPAGWSSAPEPVDEPAPAYAEPSPWREAAEADLPGWRSGPEPEPPVEQDDDLLEDEDLLGGERYGGTVLVVPGRPRYHVAGCRYLLGKESAELDVVDAREEGFQPCGICRPDVVLAAELAEGELVAELRGQRDAVVHLDADAPEPADLELMDLPGADEPRGRRSGAGGSVPVATRPRPVAAEPVAPPVPDVVLVPERGRYHRPTCRYARGAAGTQQVAPDAARAAGAQPCGICKP